MASLLTFPSAIAWMVAVWLAWHTCRAWRGHPAWMPLAACLAILLVKRVPWLPGLAACMGLMLAAAIGGWWRSRSRNELLRSRRAIIGWLALAWLGWCALLVEWHRSSHTSRMRVLDLQRPIICIGDSLTSGIEPEPGYPEHLAGLVTVPVINLGRAGITTAEGLKMLPRLEAAKPQTVIIELGGHDFLKGAPREATKANLRKLIEAARAVGAEPILVEIPRGFMIDPDAGLERELAPEEDLELIPDSVIRKLVLWSPSAPPGMWTGGPYLSDDGLHPNQLGNAELARAVAHALRRVYGAEVLQ